MGIKSEMGEDRNMWGRRRHCCVKVGGRKLELVEVVKYLEVIISREERMEEEVSSRLERQQG